MRRYLLLLVLALPLLADDQPISPAVSGGQGQPSAVAIGDRIIVAFTESERLRIAVSPFDREPTAVAIGSKQGVPSLATNGSSILAVWVDRPDSDDVVVVSAAALDQDGRAITAPVILGDDVYGTNSAVAWDGSEFVAVWERGSDRALMARRVSSDALAIDPAPQIIAATTSGPYFNAFARLIALNGELIVVWSSIYYPAPPPFQGRFEIRALRLSRNLTPLDSPRVISGHGISPAVATDGSDLFVVWLDDQSILATRLTPLLDPIGEEVVVANVYGAPSAEWSGDHYIVAAGDTVERVSRDGQPVIRLRQLPRTIESIVVANTVIYSSEGRLFVRSLSTAPPRRRSAVH